MASVNVITTTLIIFLSHQKQQSLRKKPEKMNLVLGSRGTFSSEKQIDFIQVMGGGQMKADELKARTIYKISSPTNQKDPQERIGFNSSSCNGYVDGMSFLKRSV